MEYISIAVDGPAGSGKSTITKMVAEKIGYNYVDTGAMYRALTLNFLENNLKQLDEEKIEKLLSTVQFEVKYVNGKQFVLIDGKDVGEKIRTSEVSQYTSLFAKNSQVRNFLIDTQRNLTLTNNIIMDGRDIGSVVLPNANLKIFLTASVEERARRRFEDFKKQGVDIDIEKVKEDIKTRDYQDENREIAPLIMVEDAVKIDTTTLTIDQVVEKIITLIRNVEN